MRRGRDRRTVDEDPAAGRDQQGVAGLGEDGATPGYLYRLCAFESLSAEIVDRHVHALRLLVQDDGVGIPETKLATMFERGIGVSNINERLKLFFGGEYRMWIDSKPGQGTKIEIELPELQPNRTTLS